MVFWHRGIVVELQCMQLPAEVGILVFNSIGIKDAVLTCSALACQTPGDMKQHLLHAK